MESLPFSSPDEFPTLRNLLACFSGLNDRQAHGQYHKTRNDPRFQKLAESAAPKE